MVRPRASPCSTRASTAQKRPSSRAASSGLRRFQQLADHGWRKSSSSPDAVTVSKAVTREAFHLAHIGKRREVAGAALAEFEIMAHHHAADAQARPAARSPRNPAALRCAMSASKGSANSASTPSSASSRALARSGVRRNRDPGDGPEIFLRMRLESQHRQRAPARLGLGLGFGDQGRWPRCTPSKLPIATTAPRKAAGTSSK